MSGAGKLAVLGELWAFMKVRKKWWLGPVMVMLLLVSNGFGLAALAAYPGLRGIAAQVVRQLERAGASCVAAHSGSEGLVLAGTTGESPTLTREEDMHDHGRLRIPLLAELCDCAS